MSKLYELLTQLGSDPQLLDSFVQDREKVMSEAGLSDEEKQAVCDEDVAKIRELTNLENVQAINSIIKAYNS